jgi:hypothetical protein
MPHSNQPNPKHDPSTSSNSELVEIVDPVGGLSLDDPEVQNRERVRRSNRSVAPDDKPSSSD